MNTPEIAGRVADRTGMSRSAAGDAVDAVFATVSEALTNREQMRVVGFDTFGTSNCPVRTRPTLGQAGAWRYRRRTRRR